MEQIKIIKEELLSDNWYTLKKYTYEILKQDGIRQIQTREVYDRGNGAVILLYNQELKTVILTRQFRLPSFVNGNSKGVLIEACAGCWTRIIRKKPLKGKRRKKRVIVLRM